MFELIEAGRKRWFNAWTAVGDRPPVHSLQFMLLTVAILGIYFCARVALFKLTVLPESGYFEPFLYWGFLKHLASEVLILVVLMSAVICFNRQLFVGWSEFENGTRLRNVVFFMAALLTWRHAFYDYNFLLDQAHLWDRLLLIISCALIMYRPFFVIPFLTVVLVIIGQFEIVRGYSLADSQMPLQILLMFSACYVLRLLTRYFDFNHFIYLMACVIATNYFFSGLGKLNWDWVLRDQISLLLPDAYAHGWLGFLRQESIESITKSMNLLNVPMKVMTLGIELGILCFFWRLKWTRALLLVTFLFHIGIFVTTGICFWLWMLIHAFLIVYIWKPSAVDESRLFNFPSLVCAVCIIATGKFWSDPVELAWLDVPFTYSYRIEAETEGGEVNLLSSDFFGPYDYNFVYQDLQYVNDSLIHLGVGGPGTTGTTLQFFLQDRTDDEILDFEFQTGRNRYNKANREQLVLFLKTFFRNREKRGAEFQSYLSFFKPPDLLWQSQGVSSLAMGDKVVKLSVVCDTKYYSSVTGIRTVRHEKLLDVEIMYDN